MTLIDSVVWGLIKTDLDTLTKVISRHNPDKEIVQLKKSLKLLEERNHEIDEEIKTLNQSFKGFSKLKNITSGDFINSIQIKVKKLDKEKGDIDNEISRIKVNLSVKNEDVGDDYKSIKNNLKTIEESKELLKKYINLFVDKIDIIIHNTSYSVIRLKFKIDSFSFLPNPIKKNSLGAFDDGEIGLYTNIILDKRNSQKVKSYKTTISIQKSNNQRSLLLVDTKTPKIVKRTKIELCDLEKPENKKYFTSFKFIKLNVY